jgi:hypothetical protein
MLAPQHVLLAMLPVHKLSIINMWFCRHLVSWAGKWVCRMVCYFLCSQAGHLTSSHCVIAPFTAMDLQRYAPASSSNNSALRSTAAPAPPCHSWCVLQLLQPEPGPLGMHCQAYSG